MTLIRIPSPLRPYTDGQKEIEVEGKTVGSLIQGVATQYPRIQPHLFDEDGALRAYVNIFLNNEDVRHLGGYETPVADNDKLMIVPSIAGGAFITNHIYNRRTWQAAESESWYGKGGKIDQTTKGNLNR